MDQDRSQLTSFLQKQSPVYIEQEILSISKDLSSLDGSEADEQDLRLMCVLLQYIEELVKANDCIEFSQVSTRHAPETLAVCSQGSVEVGSAEEHDLDHCNACPDEDRSTDPDGTEETLGSTSITLGCDQQHDHSVQWDA